MKIYIREIKPYIDPPALPGTNCAAYPVDGYDWVPESHEERLRHEIIVKDSWSRLVFKERYVSKSLIDIEKMLLNSEGDRYDKL